MTVLWDNAIAIVGFVSGVISLLLPLKVRSQRWFLAGYIFVVVVLASFITQMSSELSRRDAVARVADQLVEDRQMKYGHRAFVLASLSFLEKHRDLYPDTYARAQTLCVKFQCDDPAGDAHIVELAFTMSGIVRGLGTMSK